MYLVSNQHRTDTDRGYAGRALLEAMLFNAVCIFLPTLALSSAMGQIWPLVLMAGVVTVGTILGILLHRKLDREAAVEIPFAHVPSVPKNVVGFNFKKAA